MDEIEKLKQAMETNFRLNSLQNRELAAEMRRGLRGVETSVQGVQASVKRVEASVKEVEATVKEVEATIKGVGTTVKSVSEVLDDLGDKFYTVLNEQADRADETLAVINRILDSNSDLRRTTADHERRIRRLEDLAS